MKFHILGFPKIYREKFKLHYNLTRRTSPLQEELCNVTTASSSLLKMRTVSDKSCRQK